MQSVEEGRRQRIRGEMRRRKVRRMSEAEKGAASIGEDNRRGKVNEG